MATTNNVIVPNQQPLNGIVVPPQVFNTVWKLTRGMKKAGWKYKASGDGTSKNTSSDPSADLWGDAGTVSSSGASASITANTRGRATVQGLSGITALDKGRFLRVQGSGSGNNGYHQIEEIISGTSVKIDARTATITSPDANNGSLTWDVHDPLGTTYPTALNSVVAWWTAQGPSIIKIPITAAPAAGPAGFTFLRGENIVQSTTGFEGEIIGFVYYSGAGYLTVAPRLRGTGAGVFGLTTGEVFTGGTSGATVTQNGTALEYRYEVTFWKAANTTQGLVFVTQAEPVAEGAANLFSALAASAGCTATVAPGGGGTGNAFPTFAWVQWGSAAAIANAIAWVGAGQAAFAPWGNTQIICVDLIEEQNYSADGSWMWIIGSLGTSSPPGGGTKGLGFVRCDDGEDGDLSPYVTIAPVGTKTIYTTIATTGRTNAGTIDNGGSIISGDQFSLTSMQTTTTQYVMYAGWYRRGLSLEHFVEFEIAALRPVQSSTTSFLMNNATGEGDRIVTAPQATIIREPVWVVCSFAGGNKMRKGTLRWFYTVGPGGGVGRLLDGARWAQISSTFGAFVVGPWDPTVALLIA